MSIIAMICGMTLSQFTSELFGSNLTRAELEKAKLLMEVLVVNVALTFPSSIFDSIVSAHECFLFQRILQLLSIICNPLVTLPLLLATRYLRVVVCVTTIITIAKLATNVWFCSAKLCVRFVFSRFDFGLLREIAAFSFFLFINMMIDQVNWSVDKFILGRVAGTGAVAVYGVGSQINTLFQTFSTSISSVFSPRVNRIAAARRPTIHNEFTDLFIKVGRMQFIILGLIASGFIIFGKYFIVNIYATEEYAQAYPVALLLILPAITPLIQNLGIEIQRSVNKHQFRAIAYLFMAGVNILISIPLARKYGPIGAAVGTAISLIVSNGIVMNVYYYKAIKIDVIKFWRNILKMSRALIVPACVGFFIMNYINIDGIVSFFVGVASYTLIYVISFWIFGMNVDEKKLIVMPAKKMMVAIQRRI